MAINKSTVFSMKIDASITSWTKKETNKIDRKTKKVLTIIKELPPRSDFNSLYVSRTERRRLSMEFKI